MKKIHCALLILTFLLVACKDEQVMSENDVMEFESDLEVVKERDKVQGFVTSVPGIRLGGGDGINQEYARSGLSCLRLDSINKYGLNYKIENVEPQEFFQISVWVHKTSVNATLHAYLQGEASEYRYRTTTDKSAADEDGWQKHTLSFTVGPGIDVIHIDVFSGGHIAYFDDFSLLRMEHAPENDLPIQLNLDIPDSSLATLDEYIMYAANFEAIPASSKKYVSANLVEGEDTAKIQMKLKGDWTDHLHTGKESYRIKIKGDLAFQGLKSFSIQHPKTRRYIGEWVVHKIADREGVLTTTYDFINVNISDVQMGVYALEEHFDKQLLEHRNRREGPILKFDETSYWTAIKQNVSFDSMKLFPFFQESTVSCFKKNRTRKSDQLSKQFDEGKKLMQLFKDGYLKIEDLFDIDQLAKFYVVMELSGSSHGLRWHNRRFYYNPITQKLEHVAYDILPFIQGRNFQCDMARRLSENARIRENCFDNAILYNSEFQTKYLYYLDQKTKPAYLDSVFEALEDELAVAELAIQTEVPAYNFQKEIYYDNAAYLRTWLPRLKAAWDRKITEKPRVDDWVLPQSYIPRSDHQFLRDLSINAYLKKEDNGYRIRLQSFHSNTITVHGYGIKDDSIKHVLLAEPIELNGFVQIADTAEFLTVLKPKKIYFTVSNSPSLIVAKKVLPWEKPEGSTARMTLARQFSESNSYYTVRNKQVIFKGSVVVDSLLYIPKAYEVVLKPGTTIEFKTGGGIIASNSFYAEGTITQPIHVFCSDSSSNGITVLNGETAVFSHCLFEGLSNLNYKNWELTGALSIYETPTSMLNCTISGNLSEDALNIIRSDFSISALNISDTYSDGFDADFCTGHIEKSSFTRTGNDCIDFSGSTVLIEAITINNSGDKGISGGEASALILNNVTINGAVTGVAAKDGTVITGANIAIENVEYALAAFRKKPEYDGAQIDFKTVLIKAAQEKMLVELKSSITIDGKRTQGTKKLDIEALYARFE
ncbi:MAG: hypothetical protein GQ574_04885 [Crocinitomix sp.]|nr:hypothetical protein [Crocinitomix sp.]